MYAKVMMKYRGHQNSWCCVQWGWVAVEMLKESPWKRPVLLVLLQMGQVGLCSEAPHLASVNWFFLWLSSRLSEMAIHICWMSFLHQQQLFVWYLMYELKKYAQVNERRIIINIFLPLWPLFMNENWRCYFTVMPPNVVVTPSPLPWFQHSNLL